MFERTLGNGYVPFTQAQGENTQKGFSIPQEQLYAGNPMVQKDGEEKEAKAVQTPYMSMQQAPQMPQTPYAYAQNMAKAPEAKMPTYAGAPMTATDTE